MSTTSQSDKTTRWGIIGIILGAIGASICCIGPLVLLALGIGGAWVGNLSAFETYRPIFMGITLAFLGFAHYRVYKNAKAAECCEVDGQCATPQRQRFMKTTLWIVTVLAVGLMAFPYVAPGLANTARAVTTAPAQTQTVELAVHNMTCGSCAFTAQQALTKVDGVVQANVSFDERKAVVTFDPKKTRVEDLITATTNVGYPSEPLEGK